MREQVVSRSTDDPKLRFSLGISMLHRSVEPDEVSQALDWEPGWTSRPGVEKADQARASLGSGMQKAWAGEKLFFRRVVGMLRHLEDRREFVRSYVEAGGDVVLTVRLFGQVDIGDVLGAEEMMRMAKLGIALQVEVVTKWVD